MNAREQSELHDILEECYDVQLELGDLGEAYELLIYDIELAIGEISETLERVQEHLQKVEDAFHDCSRRLQDETGAIGSPQEFPWE